LLKPLLRSVSLIFTALAFACTAEAPTENGDTADPGATADPGGVITLDDTPNPGDARDPDVGGDIQITVAGVVVADPADPPMLEFDRTTLSPGQAVQQLVLVRNVGVSALTVTRARLTPIYPGQGSGFPTFALVDAVRREPSQGGETSVAITGSAVLEQVVPVGGELALTILYSRHEGAEAHFALLSIESDASDPDFRTVAIPVVAAQGGPIATISPAALDFGDVASSSTKSLTTVVTNTGFDWLTMSEYTLAGPGFRVRNLSNPWAPALEVAAGPMSLLPPIALAPGESSTFEVIYTAPSLASVEGSLRLSTNGDAAWEEILLLANGKWPCLEVTPDPVVFGAASIGKTSSRTLTLSACGKHPVKVHGIGLDAAGPATFALDLSALPSGAAPTSQDPLIIEAGGSVNVEVLYTPVGLAPAGETGPTFESSVLRVLSDAYVHEHAVVLTGFGADVLCPTAVGAVVPGTVVPYGTNLKLSSGASFAAPGRTVGKSQWSVSHSMGASSPGAVGTFIPSAFFPAPIFESNLLGEYTFRLDVWDDQDLQSCVPWTTKVTVVTTQSFHVELTWRTPNDQDETDEGAEAGSNLDLHFAALDYTSGSNYDGDGDGKDDPWFGSYDTFWFTPSPNWGTLNPAAADDPMMLRDHTDGGGPEAIAAGTLKAGQYGIAVHYWDDYGYGDAWAKVRVHAAGNLVLETEEVLLSMGDLWNVATVQFPALTVTPLETPEGTPLIYPGYANPQFSP
jgi:hypothetical protein